MWKVQLQCRESGRLIGSPRVCATQSEALQTVHAMRGLFHPDSFDVCVWEEPDRIAGFKPLPCRPWTTEEILAREG